MPRPTPEHEHRFVESIEEAMDLKGVWLERVTWPCDVKGCNEFGYALTTDGRYVSGVYRIRDDPGKAEARRRLRDTIEREEVPA